MLRKVHFYKNKIKRKRVDNIICMFRSPGNETNVPIADGELVPIFILRM